MTTTKDLLRPLQPLARSVIGATATATSRLRMRPDFLIVGGQRCGTTSLFKTLAQHPEVARPFAFKGVHYFDMHHDRSFGWYRGHFPIRITSQLKRLGRRGPITGESSPFYGFHPLAPQRIAAELPGVRLLMLLRDPVERAYSAHSHERARGFETETFERALELEEERTHGEREKMLADPTYVSFHLQHHAYLARGRYIEQIEALEAAVGPGRLHVVDSQEFFTRPEETFAGVLDFLGLPPHDGITFERHNARDRNPMKSDMQQRLLAKFDETDARLARWWGRPLSWRE
ncbi:sulfotransferase family protein [Microbacterium sp. bgisy189]|uniref:sulfotransferase family protein n=1 Tax=Microbacterium sp. bgisy189 TaxID=3413798 RepID=UPI003EBAEEB9